MKKLFIPAALCVGAASAFTAELYKYTFCRDAGALAPFLDKKNHSEAYYEYRDKAADELKGNPECIPLSLINADGHALRGFYLPCPHPCGKLAFIIHGYRSEHAETAGMFTEYYHSRGFDVFCCDHAGHGESEGSLIGWSITESRDCLRWLEYLIARFGEELQIALHGFSMGGATVLRMSAQCPPQVKFIVSDSGFSSAEGILRPSLKGGYALMRAINCVVGGYDVSRADVRPALALTDKPILFVHGRLDPTVPFSMGEELFALCPSEKDSLFTDDAKHIETMYLHPELYAAKLDSFIEKHMG